MLPAPPARGTNPVETHPRHLKRYAYTPSGKFVPGGRHDRTMILVDVRETLSARAADQFLQIQPETDFELLTRREADAALIIAADPWSTMPEAAIEHLETIPHVVIDRAGASRRAKARVQFITASPGIDSPGTAYRMDWVPVSMRPAICSPQTTDEDVLGRIRAGVRS